MNSYASLCNDFGVSTYVHSKLPNGRETVLHFFEALQKGTKMTEFEKRSDTEYMLEEDREPGNYRWASLDHRRLSAGYVNPPAIEDADWRTLPTKAGVPRQWTHVSDFRRDNSDSKCSASRLSV